MIKKPEIKFGQKWLLFGYGLSLPGCVYLRRTEKELYPTFSTLWHELSHEIDWQTGYTVGQYLKDLLRYGYRNHPAEVRARRFEEYHARRFYRSGLSWQKYLDLVIDEINRLK